MRGKWNHTQTADHQSMPEDNTTEHVTQQVGDWASNGRVVHPEIAMEIASWWHSPSPRDWAITAFASHGEIPPDAGDLLDTIRRCIRECVETADDDMIANVMCLVALFAYVEVAAPLAMAIGDVITDAQYRGIVR